MGSRRRIAAAFAVAVGLAVPGAALAADHGFPGSDPTESPRIHTPNDPEFDQCESDDQDAQTCDSYWNEEFRLFGFSPDSAQQAPGMHTQYADCSQLDQQGRDANVAAGDPACSQIAGVRADTAWKYSAGDPNVTVAILDTGIRWDEPELVDRVHLNKGELPLPEHADGSTCADYDCNGDGAFNVEDYRDDPRVAKDAGDSESDAILDASDLIATFSDGTDADHNGYVDDIAGWDFFDDDNDPFDASSCCSAHNHGTGRARDALGEGNNGLKDLGVCPHCQLMPLRVWDTFVVPTDNWAMGLVYAADNGASVAEGAVGGLTNTEFARKAFTYADRKGMALMLVSSDINSADHNYPTNYNEAIYVNGSLPDPAPNNTCTGPGGLPGLGDVPGPGNIPGFTAGCQQFLGLLGSNLGITPTAQPPTTSFFRNSNLTQYGGKADIAMMGTTGSEATGQAAGAAGLLASYGRQTFGAGDMLSGNEIRQLLTMTAEDVLPQNTGSTGLPDKANPGWDPHFGYGRVDLAAAMARIHLKEGQPVPTGWPCGTERSCIPPEAQLDSPAWFAPIDVSRVPASGVPIRGFAAAPHSSSGVGSWQVGWACGQDALDSDFQPIPGASGTGPVNGTLGTIPKALLQNLADHCDGSVSNDPGRPAGTADQAWPQDPYPKPDPERHAFQIRLTVHDAAHPANIGRYRKTLFAYNDDGNLAGWPKPIGTGSQPADYVTGSGGETSPRLYDVNGDNKLDFVLPTSSGELYVLNSDGSPVKSFNNGHPVKTEVDKIAAEHLPGGDGLPPPHESLRVPAIGDIDGDHEAEIVATAGEHVYAWNLDGTPVKGFPVRVDPAFSDPCKPGAPHPCFNADDRALTPQNHLKRGFVGSPALADLNGDGRLDVVAGALDQHVYAWDGEGKPLPGFPVKLSSPGADGAEIITSPAIAQLDGHGPPEVILATNEVISGSPQFPDSFFSLFNAFLGSATGFNPVYAIHGDGTPVSGWPVKVGVAAGDLLPLVLPGNDAAAVDTNGDGTDEAIVSAGTATAQNAPLLVNGDGSTIHGFQNGANDSPDQGVVVDIADFPVVGDLTGLGSPDVLKGGLTANGAANLLAVNQNLPFSHVEQGWDLSSGAALPGYPRATDDFQLLSEPAIARVSGSGPARQVLVGTGMYQLHAYGPTGAEAPGWPKFTGGWINSTPAVGDANGDGKLDVAEVTREGWSFLWKTNVGACSGSNNEWWTFHHDELGTANYGTDGRPPGSPEGLAATRQGDGSVKVSWEQPGDDWMCGKPAHYQVLASPDPIRDPGDADVIASADATGGPGASASATFSQAKLSKARYVAVIYRDDAGNWGLLRSTRLPAGATPGPGPGPHPHPHPHPRRCAHKVVGTNRADRLTGNARSDLIRGRAGRDRIRGRAGGDCIHGGRGRDRIWAGKGRDRVFARGGKRDLVRCGAGHDTAVVDRRDAARGCETVRRR